LTQARTFLPIRLIGALAVVGALSACVDRPTPIAVHVTLRGEPLAGREIVALPYDPERLLDSLAAVAPTPRPEFADLEAKLRTFRPPVPDAESAEANAWRATRDSTARLADSLRTLNRRAPGYGAAYQRFRALYGRLVQRSTARDAARHQVTADVRDLARRAGRAADSLRAWERDTYASLDSAARLAAAGRRAMTDTTGPDGWVLLELPPGAWHLQLRQPVADNPFLEVAWNVPVVVSVFPFRMRVTEALGDTVWRH
jgi:hypothetical protein